MVSLIRRRISRGNTCNIITTLGFGDNVTVSSQLKIGTLDGSTAQFQLLGTFAQGGHTAAFWKPVIHDQFPVMMIDLQIKTFFFFFLM